MKKALSVFLAVLMMFSVLGVGSFAAEDTTSGSSTYLSPWHGPEGSGKPANYSQVVLVFELNGGIMKNPMPVYQLDTNPGRFVYTENITGSYAMVPMDPQSMVGDGRHQVTLPPVTPPAGQQFDGWYCYYDYSLYGANGPYRIPEGTGGSVITFMAQYSPATVEPDTMQKVMGILMKVFGTILGLLMYGGDTEAGIAMMNKLFGSIFA